jgi:sulfate adenylyltransferase
MPRDKHVAGKIPPHGGKLVERVVKFRERAERMIQGLPAYELQPTRDPKTGLPIRHVGHEIVSICYGFFSPLEGFMTREEVESVLKERRLPDGWLWPMPIVFDIPEEDLKKLGIKEGDQLLLLLHGKPFAVLDVDEIFKYDPKELATKTFGTKEAAPGIVQMDFDEKHPGWLQYASTTGTYIGGKVTLVNEPVFDEPYSRLWTPPKKAREEIIKRGWRLVIAHQTRNVPHVGHEHLMKFAMLNGDIEPCDAVLVNAIIGVKRLGDYVDEAILEGHEMVNKAGYIAPEHHMVTFTLWDMKYGHPVEAVLHAIIRQNMGCTHHMFGRDHAAVGDYYHPYAAHTLWKQGIPGLGFPEPPHETYKGVLIKPVLMKEILYCRKCGELVYTGCWCNHKSEWSKFSGSFIRSLIIEGVEPPPLIMRPEVFQVIMKWWEKLGTPFVNKTYLSTRKIPPFDLKPMEYSPKK